MPQTAVSASSAIQWGDFPTWALAGIALLALIAAVAAYLKQAGAAKKLAEQVDLQRDQLKDQQKANNKQAEVLEAQLCEIRQRAEAIERQQADAVSVARKQQSEVPGIRPEDGPVHMAVVENESRRPIRNVVCRIRPKADDLLHEAYSVGWIVNRPPAPTLQRAEQFDRLEGQAQDTRVPLVRAGERAAFVFMYAVAMYPGFMVVRFTDDAGLHWEIDHDLHLEKLDNRDDW